MMQLPWHGGVDVPWLLLQVSPWVQVLWWSLQQLWKQWQLLPWLLAHEATVSVMIETTTGSTSVLKSL